MHRPKFGSVLAAAAVAMAAVVPVFVASPAGAANGCTAGEFPSTFAAQSGLKVACHTDPGTTANHIDVHDAPNVEWHHGAARNVSLVGSPSSFTAGSAVLKFASGTLKNTDLRRPINAFCTKNATPGNNNCASAVAKDSVFKGGTNIIALLPGGCTAACTSATLSQPATLTGGTGALPIIAVVEHTNNRYLHDVTCGAGTSTISSADAKFVAGDIGKGVSGGPIPSGTFITSVTATVATLNQAHAGGCTTAAGQPGDQITIGGSTYVGGTPQLFNADPMAIHLSNTTGGGQGFTCTGSTLSMTAASKLDTGGFNANYIGLSVAIKGSGVAYTNHKINAVSVAGNSSATIAPACPAGVTATTGNAGVSTKGAGAPTNGAAMMTLGAALNLNPVLVATQDDCSLNTYEGFMVVGGWTNPGSAYAGNTSTPLVSVAQIIFPTSVISFNGFIVPQRGGDAAVVGVPHYDFSFPLLPTSLAVCLSGGTPANDVQLTLGMNPTTLAGVPFLATGSGNVGDPPTRQLLPQTGTFSWTIQLILNPATIVATDTPSCTIAAATATPGTPCGDG
jgi:hypothetical protein